MQSGRDGSANWSKALPGCECVFDEAKKKGEDKEGEEFRSVSPERKKEDPSNRVRVRTTKKWVKGLLSRTDSKGLKKGDTKGKDKCGKTKGKVMGKASTHKGASKGFKGPGGKGPQKGKKGADSKGKGKGEGKDKGKCKFAAPAGQLRRLLSIGSDSK